MHAEPRNVEDFTKLLQKLLLGSFYLDPHSYNWKIRTVVSFAFCLGNQEKKLDHSGDQLRPPKIWTTLWKNLSPPFSTVTVTKAVGRHCPKLLTSVACLKAPKGEVCSINEFTLISLKFHSLSCSQIKPSRKHSSGAFISLPDRSQRKCLALYRKYFGIIAWDLILWIYLTTYLSKSGMTQERITFLKAVWKLFLAASGDVQAN